MSYRGNSSLAPELQQRVESTYKQSVELARQGRHREALLGCEFVLNLDPEYRPGQALQAQLQEIAGAAAGPAAQQTAAAAAPQSPAPQGPAPQGPAPQSPAPGPQGPQGGAMDELDALDDLGDLGDLGDLDDLAPPTQGAAAAPPAAPTAAAAPSTGLGAVLHDLLARRNYQQVLQIAQTQQQAIASNPELQKMVSKASELQESEAFIQSFLESARRALNVGQTVDAEKLLAKAQALDPEHPAVVQLAAELASKAAGGAGPVPIDTSATPDNFDPRTISQEVELADLHDSMPAGAPAQEDAGPLGAPSPVAPDPVPSSTTLGSGELDLNAGFDLGSEEPAPPTSFDPGGVADPEPAPAELSFADLGTSDLASGSSGADSALPSLEPEVPTFAPSDSFAEPAGDSSDEEGPERIEELLAEGQAAFERQAYQEAIDVWSRIFLLDLNHEEASRRIEAARQQKAEVERQAEEAYHEGLTQLEARAAEEAKTAFRLALELDPTHSGARELLEQLEAGQMPDVSNLVRGGDREHDPEADLQDLAAATLGEDADRSLEAAVQRDRMVAVKKADRRLVMLGAVVLIPLLAGAAFLAMNWSNFFPGGEDSAPKVKRPGGSKSLLERAEQLVEEEELEAAVQILKRLPEDDDDYEAGQDLLTELELQLSAPPEAPQSVGPDPQEVARSEQLLAAARQAYGEGELIRATRYFEAAGKVLPLTAEDVLLVRDAERQLGPLEDAIALFERGDYSSILPDLWRRLDSEPNNRDLRLLILDSYHNLALRDLQRGEVGAAASKLSEALEVDANNQDLARMHNFAVAYTDREQDLLYRTFVKYLSAR